MTQSNFNRKSIERAERVAHRLDLQRLDRIAERKQLEDFAAALADGKSWRRPGSLSVTSWSNEFGEKKAKVKRYEFTDAQLEIALRSLDARGAV